MGKKPLVYYIQKNVYDSNTNKHVDDLKTTENTHQQDINKTKITKSDIGNNLNSDIKVSKKDVLENIYNVPKASNPNDKIENLSRVNDLSQDINLGNINSNPSVSLNSVKQERQINIGTISQDTAQEIEKTIVKDDKILKDEPNINTVISSKTEKKEFLEESVIDIKKEEKPTTIPKINNLNEEKEKVEKIKPELLNNINEEIKKKKSDSGEVKLGTIDTSKEAFIEQELGKIGVLSDTTKKAVIRKLENVYQRTENKEELFDKVQESTDLGTLAKREKAERIILRDENINTKK